MFEKILAATDGSENADRALRVAGDLASHYDAHLTVLYAFSGADIDESVRHVAEVEHLVPSQYRAAGGGVGSSVATGLPLEPVDESDSFVMMYHAAEEIGRIVANRGADTAREAGASKIDAIAVPGRPADVILDIIGERKIDLVVMGSRGHGALTGLLVGSVSNKVGHVATCCCLTVK